VIDQGIYADLERSLLPMVRSLSYRFANQFGVDGDDIFQEMRIALWEGFKDYDYNRSYGNVRRFAQVVIKKALCSQAYKATTRVRNPHTVFEDESGEAKTVRHPLASLEDIHVATDEEGNPNPEESVCLKELGEKAGRLRMRLFRSLRGRERQVFKCKFQPSEQFLLYLRNVAEDGDDEPTNVRVAEFLGITKNAIDWSLHKIRRRFVELAEEPEFSALIADIVKDGEWPMIYVSEKADDHEFVRRVMARRKLDPRPSPNVPRDVQYRGEGQAGRIVEAYHWGSVIHLRFNGEARTVVVEGRFNKLTGEIHGEFSNWKSLAEVVPWYRRLNTELST